MTARLGEDRGVAGSSTDGGGGPGCGLCGGRVAVTGSLAGRAGRLSRGIGWYGVMGACGLCDAGRTGDRRWSLAGWQGFGVAARQPGSGCCWGHYGVGPGGRIRALAALLGRGPIWRIGGGGGGRDQQRVVRLECGNYYRMRGDAVLGRTYKTTIFSLPRPGDRCSSFRKPQFNPRSSVWYGSINELTDTLREPVSPAYSHLWTRNAWPDACVTKFAMILAHHCPKKCERTRSMHLIYNGFSAILDGVDLNSTLFARAVFAADQARFRR